MTFIKLHINNSKRENIIIKAKPLTFVMSRKKLFYSLNGQPAVAIETNYS